MFLFTFLLLFLSSNSPATPAYITFPSNIDWMEKESPHFRIIFRKGFDDLADRALRASERAHRLLIPIFREGPDKTWVVLADFHDSTNGYALNFPYPHMVIFATPPDPAGSLSALDDWLDSLILHEYVHILHLYPAHGFWSGLRTIFGTGVVPNGLMPSHFHEGMAVLLETKLSQGGRGTGSYFRMLNRMAVHKGVWGKTFSPLDLMEPSVENWPHGVTPYFFGYILKNKLWEKKGASGIYDLTQKYSRNWPYFLNGPLDDVYGQDYPSLWKEIFETKTIELEKEISGIKGEGLSELNYLSHTLFYKGDLHLSPDKNRVAYRKSHPEEGTFLEIFDLTNRTVTSQFEIKSSESSGMCWIKQNEEEKLFFLDVVSDFGESLNYIHIYNPVSNRKITKSASGHFHHLACDGSNRLFAYEYHGGIGKIREFNMELKPIREWKLSHASWVTGILVQDEIIVSSREGLSTVFYQLTEKEEVKKILSLKGHAYHLRKGLDKNIIAIADFDGREEVWNINFRKHVMKKIISLLGGANSFEPWNEHYLLLSYEHGGFDLSQAKPVLFTEKPIKPYQSDEPIEETHISEATEYSPLRTILPRAWIPSLFFVPNGFEIGAWIPHFDLSQKHFYQLFGGYDSRGSIFANASYQYRFKKSNQIGLNVYFSPSYLQSSKDFFKQWGGGLSWGFNLFASPVSLGPVYKKLESSRLGPAKTSVGVQLTVSRTLGTRTRPQVNYPLSGTHLSISHSQFFKKTGSSDNSFNHILSASQSIELPLLKEHVFWISSKFGYTEGTSLINSYFEGGGELLFHQDRGFFLNRGFEPGLFLGRRMWTAQIEYRFPLAWIERGIKLWPLRLKSLHGAFVSDVLSYDLGQRYPSGGITTEIFKKYYVSLGVELKSEWKFFYYLPTQMRLGAYHGFGPLGQNVYVTFGMEAGL